MAHWTDAGKQGIEIRTLNDSRGRQFNIWQNGEVRFTGIQYAGKIKIFKQDGNRIIFKVGGGSSWCGIGGDSFYSRPQFLIGMIKDGEFHERWNVEYGQSTKKEGIGKALEFYELLSQSKE